ncbi:tyrosine-type recombinase/integrase [Bradyrhizobium sp. AZCC 2289]|uniref:tyrosine-type recombinase/integrase n=1 Tax=Bradyrhizobium sp. AZCC 2289 TaxID=3117026 RepID=UPI002FF3E366
MSVYRHKNSPYWQFDFQIDGYRFSGSTELTGSKRDAQAFEDGQKANARELLANIAAAGSAPLTLKRACDRWWSEHGQHLNDPDLKARLDWIASQIGPQTLLHAITDDMVSKMVEARRLDVRRSGCDEDGKQFYRPITARTVNKTTLSLLRRVMRRAQDNWNATILREPKWKNHWLKETKRPIREISLAEDAALDAVEDADFTALRRFAIITGLRRRNLLLTWPQVDFEAAVVRVVAKGGVPRVVPLSQEAYAILWARRGQHPSQVFTFIAQRTRPCPKTRDPKTGERFKFIKGQRYPITYYGMGSNKRKWAKAGIDARIHDMRHTTGSRMVRKTGNLKAAQLLLGHSDIAVTAKFYANVMIEDVRAAMETTAAAEQTANPAIKRVTKIPE